MSDTPPSDAIGVANSARAMLARALQAGFSEGVGADIPHGSRLVKEIDTPEAIDIAGWSYALGTEPTHLLEAKMAFMRLTTPTGQSRPA